MSINRFSAHTAGRTRKRGLLCAGLLCALIISSSAPPAYAESEDFTVTIAEPAAETSREFILEAPAVGGGEVFSRRIMVENKDKNAYEISLTRIDTVVDSSLTECLSFLFTDVAGRERSFTKRDFGKALGGEDTPLYRSDAGSSGSFIVKTVVGHLTNAHQGLSCKIRFTFRIVRAGRSQVGKAVGQGGGPAARKKDDDEPEPPRPIPGTGIPTAPLEGREYWSLLSLLMSIVAALIALRCVIGAYRRRRAEARENERLREKGVPEEVGTRNGAWKELVLAVGVLIPAVWLLLDNLSAPPALINANTKWVAIAFGIYLTGVLAYQIKSGGNNGKRYGKET